VKTSIRGLKQINGGKNEKEIKVRRKRIDQHVLQEKLTKRNRRPANMDVKN